jgi:hypothetical protein
VLFGVFFFALGLAVGVPDEQPAEATASSVPDQFTAS